MKDQAQWIYNDNIFICIVIVTCMAYYPLHEGTLIPSKFLIIGETKSQVFLTCILEMRKWKPREMIF